MAKSVYQQVVTISTEYLGPSAERFISRQITTHLLKDPEKLTKRDISKLAEWVKVTFSLLTDDQVLVESFVSDLMALSANTPKAGVPDAKPQ